MFYSVTLSEGRKTGSLAAVKEGRRWAPVTKVLDFQGENILRPSWGGASSNGRGEVESSHRAHGGVNTAGFLGSGDYI